MMLNVMFFRPTFFPPARKCLPSLFLSSLFFAGACGKETDGHSRNRPAELAATDSVLLFSATDVKYESAAVYALNLTLDSETEPNIEEVLGGQSSDLIIKQFEGRAFAFNRQGGLTSYYEITPKRNDAGHVVFDVSDQYKLKGLASGDPHDVIMLDKNHLLLVSYNGGSLPVLDLRDQSLKFYEFDFGVAKGSPVMFESGLKTKDGLIALVKQGFGSGFLIDGSQAVHLFRWQDETLSLAEGPQRIGLTASLPVGLFPTKDENVFQSLTFCSKFYPGCIPGLDAVDLKARKAASVKRFNLPFQFNGFTVQDVKAQMLYASVIDGNQKKTIVSIDQTNGFVANDVYTYPDGGFTGYWGMFFDKSHDNLLVGDARSEREGSLTVIHKGVARKPILLPAIPYTAEVIELR